MTTPSPAGQTGVTIHLSRRMFGALLGLIAVPWVVTAGLSLHGAWASKALTPSTQTIRPAAQGSSASFRGFATDNTTGFSEAVALTTAPANLPQVTRSKVGPWGQLEVVPIVLDIPDEYLYVQKSIDFRQKWAFTGRSRDEALAFLRSCGFSAEQLSQAEASNWSVAFNTASMMPSDGLIRSLSKDVRAALYNALVIDKANADSIDPYWFREGSVDSRFRGIMLSEQAKALFDSMLYAGQDGSLYFADLPVAMRSLPDADERKTLFRAVSRNRAAIARLVIEADTDVNALAEYWGEGGRQKDLLPVLSSIKYNAQVGIEAPGKINLVTLLPRFARERLYNRAYVQEGTNRHIEDCFWSTFNFFSDVPDHRANDMAYLGSLVERDYYKISEPTRLGDVILLGDARGEVVHAANYVADNIVFTKNGANYTQPWMLSEMQDMLHTYRIKMPDLTVSYFRRK